MLTKLIYFLFLSFHDQIMPLSQFFKKKWLLCTLCSKSSLVLIKYNPQFLSLHCDEPEKCLKTRLSSFLNRLFKCASDIKRSNCGTVTMQRHFLWDATASANRWTSSAAGCKACVLTAVPTALPIGLTVTLRWTFMRIRTCFICCFKVCFSCNLEARRRLHRWMRFTGSKLLFCFHVEMGKIPLWALIKEDMWLSASPAAPLASIAFSISFPHAVAPDWPRAQDVEIFAPTLDHFVKTVWQRSQTIFQICFVLAARVCTQKEVYLVWAYFEQILLMQMMENGCIRCTDLKWVCRDCFSSLRQRAPPLFL